MENHLDVSKLILNPKEQRDEALRLLLKIADNIIKNPNNNTMRTLYKTNETVSKKLLPLAGVKECLQLMGFIEEEKCFKFPENKTVDTVVYAKKELLYFQKEFEAADKEIYNTQNEIAKPVVLPKLEYQFTQPFLRKIEEHFHRVLMYEDKDLQKRAKRLIPINELEMRAQIKLRLLQQQIKQKKLPDPDISTQDVLILELLDWFKNDFFTWVDSPPCESCGNETNMSHMADSNFHPYTERVEMHKCAICDTYTPFPRFNDLNILLETRRGRCGEWASVFTLLCRSLGWDVRFIDDNNDHVWCEVYSVTQKRWLHCDPCENACDTPLIYEHGWKKQINYVMAYSAEEVQDVTWRYSSNHQEVRKRRTLCREEDLLDAMLKLRAKRQENLSDSRRKYLTKRVLLELVEFLSERKPDSKDDKGRISGAEAWRLARGEIGTTPIENCSFTWIIDENLCENQFKTISLIYSSSSDQYKLFAGNKLVLKKDKWNTGVFKQENIYRKVETDWKKSYLCRNEEKSVQEGVIEWQFFVKPLKGIMNVEISLPHALFSEGAIETQLITASKSILIANNVPKVLINGNEIDNTSFKIRVSLKGGKGNTAWQHSQLFREDLNGCNEIPFCTITFL